MPSRRKGFEQPLLPLTESPLRTAETRWLTSPSYQSSLPFSATAFHSVSDALLENPNLNSSHLFRADIIFDSIGILKTNKEKEEFCSIAPLLSESDGANTTKEDEARAPLPIEGFEVRRTVLRRLIPRKPQLDRSLFQTCHIYTNTRQNSTKPDKAIISGDISKEDESADPFLYKKLIDKSILKQSIAKHLQHLVVYQPHADPGTGADMPWYHPPLKSLAFLYSCDPPLDSRNNHGKWSSLSVHFQFFQVSSPSDGVYLITDRVHRTLLSLLSTFTRLARNTPVCLHADGGEEKAMPISATQHIKDNIVPEHLVQNTYSRLKTLYASDLIKQWVEKTDPSKHVFEDLSIAAFLLELWRKTYGNDPSNFPGFVDMACGNGVLVYVLIMEGFRGFGFDARVRRTWSIFPAVVKDHLRETVCIPNPFLEALKSHGYLMEEELRIHDGIFEAGTFIISNHADELTTWTPLLASLSRLESPLPWLAIPCCSHALSGAPYRYQSCNHQMHDAGIGRDLGLPSNVNGDDLGPGEQPKTGDLMALRAAKEQNMGPIMKEQKNRTSSTYASLVNQVICLANRIDPQGDIQQTLMRIPSTRNIGILGGLFRARQPDQANGKLTGDSARQTQLGIVKRADLTRQRIHHVVEQECMKSGGVLQAAEIWMERVKHARGTTRHVFESG
jgi:tRNASer (uridine44-2'-O)-methyltransferase